MPVCLTEEMAQKLIAAADKPWYRVLVVLLLSTGIRRSEAAGRLGRVLVPPAAVLRP